MHWNSETEMGAETSTPIVATTESAKVAKMHKTILISPEI